MRADELTPIERLAQRPIRLSTEIALAVTQDIVGGRIEAGATLPSEPALCATFGVSRPVVREALKLLEQRGLIGIRRGDGTTVLPRMKWNLLDPDVLRIALESDGSELLRSDVAALRAYAVEPADRVRPQLLQAAVGVVGMTTRDFGDHVASRGASGDTSIAWTCTPRGALTTWVIASATADARSSIG